MDFFSCYIDLHNDAFFGLTLMDHMKLFNETQTEYKKPSKTEIKKIQHTIKGSENARCCRISRAFRNLMFNVSLLLCMLVWELVISQFR